MTIQSVKVELQIQKISMNLPRGINIGKFDYVDWAALNCAFAQKVLQKEGQVQAIGAHGDRYTDLIHSNRAISG